MVVANNTRVMKARLLGHRVGTGGQVEFLMLERRGPRTWEGMFRSTARAQPGLEFEIPFSGGVLRGRLTRGASESPSGTVEAEFDRDPVEAGAGVLPLPPYVERAAAAEDDESYQTVYGSVPGSAAAPTAGLHFTPEVLAAVRARGVEWHEVTLNVGLGTFRPVKVEDVREHVMHDESYEVPVATAEAVNRARREGRRVVAIGTTAVRTLESAWRDGEVHPGSGRTALFLHPGGRVPQVVDALLTNFHLPRSTLLMLVCALGGTERVLAAYREAVHERYRFFSYGDAMFIERSNPS